MENLVSLSLSGIYSLLILSLTFNFLLGIRIRQLNGKITSYEKMSSERINMLSDRLKVLENVLREG